MPERPTISTRRLVLRPLDERDAPAIRHLASDRRIAATTLTIPHPYVDGMAEVWIATHEASWVSGNVLILGIVLRDTGELTGVAGLTFSADGRSAELGYWVGVPYWGRGFASEAARALIEYGFAVHGLDRVHAHHMVHNPASGRVLEKAGMSFERVEPKGVVKWGEPVDLHHWAILRAAWEGERRAENEQAAE